MTALPTGIVAGNSGHISHHNIIHALLNPVDAPFEVASVVADVIGDLPAAGQAGRGFVDTTYDRFFLDDAATWRNPVSGSLLWVNPFDPMYGAPGDGVTDDSTAFQAAYDDLEAAGGGIMFVPRPPTAWFFDANVLVPSNVTVLLAGGLFTSTETGDDFRFFENKNFTVTDFVDDRDENIYFVALSQTTLRLATNSDGTEGPHNGGIQLKGVDGCGVDGPFRFEGGHSGIHYWGCTRMEGGGATFYRVADCGLRISWPETQALGGCVWSKLGDFVAEDTSVQLLSGSDVPEPLVALGSSLLITQSDVTLRSFIHVDGANAGNVFECGDEVQNVKIGRLEGIVNTSGRKANMVLANYDGLSIGEIITTMNADGECNIRSEGETDGSQIQQYLTIGRVIGFDRSGLTTNDLRAFKISSDTQHVKIGSIEGYGMTALFMHDGGGPDPKNIEIDVVFCQGANRMGAYVANAEHVNIGKVRTYNCGQDATENVAFRAGLVVDSMTDALIVGEIESIDTGDATQTYGLYNNDSDVIAGKTKLGGTSGQFLSDNGGTIVGEFYGSGDPESNVIASRGSTYRRHGLNTTNFYVKQTNDTTAVGWVAK